MNTASTTGVEQEITTAALDYTKVGSKATCRMERALHPELAKRSLGEDGMSVDTLSAREMVEATEKGVGLTRDPGAAARDIEIRVDHVFKGIATVTVTSSVYVDYLQLVRTRAGWKIVNALWGWVARPAGA